MSRPEKKIPLIEILFAQVLTHTPQASTHNGIIDSIGTLTEIEYAYLAGLFDADGHVSLRKNKKGNKIYTIVHVNLGFQEREVLEWVMKTYGGNIYTYKTGRALKRLKKDFHQWSIVGTRAVKFLQDVYPYIWIKRNATEQSMKEKYNV